MVPALDTAACLATAWQVAPDLSLRVVVIGGIMALAGWSGAQRHFPGRHAFLGVHLMLALWIAGTSAEHAAVDAACKATIAVLAWPLILLQPALWALFLHQYVRGDNRAPPARTWVPAGVSFALLAACAWSNGQHGWLYGPATRLGEPILGLPRMRYDYGPAFYLGAAWAYGWLLSATLIIVRAIAKCAPEDRRQWQAFLVMMMVPWAANIAYLGFGLRLFGGDPTPLSFAVAVVGFAWLIRSSRLHKVVPLSRRLLFSALPDPVLVLDSLNRVVDCNTAGHDLAGRDMPRDLPLAQWPVFGAALAELLTHGEPGDGTLVLQAGTLVLDVRCRDMGEGPRRIGRLLQLRNVTERHLAQARLAAALAERDAQLLQVAQLEAELREQTLRDPLTGLHNRRALALHFARERQRPGAQGQPLTLALLDIDHFKHINDNFGHAAGDTVLQALGHLLSEGLRTSDVVYRVGGEEFALLMPQANAEQALQRLRVLRDTARGHPLRPDGAPVTFSAGIATCHDGQRTLDDLLRAADAALYAAKAAGRDRFVLEAPAPSPAPSPASGPADAP